MTNQIWIPLHPPSLLHGKSLERQIKYINRWLNSHPFEKGWFINPKDHWAHYYYEKALKQSLSGTFHIKKSVEYGALKGVLYEKNEEL